MLDRCVQSLCPVAASIANTSSLPVTMYMIPPYTIGFPSPR